MVNTWTPVRTAQERVVAVDHESGPRPLYELRVDLKGGPVSGEWANLFGSSPIAKAGDSSMMESDPVLVGSAVMWTVSQPALPHAERFIQRRIEWANERFSAEQLWHDRDGRTQQRDVEAVRRFLERHRR